MNREIAKGRTRRGRTRAPARTVLATTCVLALLAALAPAPAAAQDAGSPAAAAFAGSPAAAQDAGSPAAAQDAGSPAMVRAPAGEGAGWGSPSAVPGALIVTTRGQRAAGRLGGTAAGLLAAEGVPARAAGEIAPGVVRVEVAAGSEAEAAEELRRQPGVSSVEPDYVLELLEHPDDPGYSDQWAHEQTGIAAAWERATGSPGVKVAILDSGVDGRHPDLQANVRAQVNVASGGAPPPHDGTGGEVPRTNVDCPAGSRGHDHGTAVAGVVGAEGDNGRGVAGVAWRVGIVDVAVTGADLPIERPLADKCAMTTVGAVTTGLQWVLEQHPDVAAVNMSFGMPLPFCPPGIQALVDRLRDRDVSVVAAAGNESGWGRMMPAGCDGVIAVGATRGDGLLAGYSTRQRYVDLVAPGGGSREGVLTTVRTRKERCDDDHYCPMAGTSFAAPYVAGVVALAQQVQQVQHERGRPQRRLRPTQIESLLEITARHPDGSGVHDERYGWGLLRAGAAIEHVYRGRGIPGPRDHPLMRWAHGDGATEPVRQAIAVSRGLFDPRSAEHVLIARSDDYADALAGSALGFGVGPILFTPPGQALFPPVLREVQRVLAPGGRVYVLGGTAAVDERVERELRQLGYQVERLSGGAREDTAAVIAEEVVRRVDELDHPVNAGVIVATRGNWPDAVAAGSFGALYGLPTLLTPVHSLHPATRARLEALDPRQVYVVGGTAAISASTAEAIGQAAGVVPQRLAGAARDSTAVAIARELERELGYSNRWPTFGIAVHLDAGGGYAHTLAASAAAGLTASVFVPVRSTPQRGTYVTDAAAEYACGLAVDVLLPGDVDILPDSVGHELQALYDRPLTSC